MQKHEWVSWNSTHLSSWTRPVKLFTLVLFTSCVLIIYYKYYNLSLFLRNLWSQKTGGTWQTGSMPLDTWSVLQKQRMVWGKSLRWPPGLHYRPDEERRAVNVPFCKRGHGDCFLWGGRRRSTRSNLTPPHLPPPQQPQKRLFLPVFTKGVMLLLFWL